MLGTKEYKGKQAYFFWDWLSRFQDYTGSLIDTATIGDKLVKMVARCMDTMDLWYGSALMMIWMLTEGPPKSRDYFSRGWCVAPRSLSLCARPDAGLEVALEMRRVRARARSQVLDGVRRRQSRHA